MEIPSPEAGVVKELKVKVGDKVSEGSLMLMLEPGAARRLPRPQKAAGSEASLQPQKPADGGARRARGRSRTSSRCRRNPRRR